MNAKTKIVTAKKTMSDKGVIEMFNQMLGTENADPNIVWPKYKQVRVDVRGISRLLSAMVNDVILKQFESKTITEDCNEVIKFTKDLDDIEFKDTTTDTYEIKIECGKHYGSIKTNNNINIIILTCRNLIQYKKIWEMENLSQCDVKDYSFVLRHPGPYWRPFPFSELNIKELWRSKKMTRNVKTYIMTVIQKIYKKCKSVYDTVTSPDVDAKQFSEVIVSSIAKVRKMVPRCDKAFDKIEASVTMLEGNFGGYYKDFVQSRNPSTIIENFVVDVSRTQNADAQTTRQFRKIINFYRKATQGKIKDPKMKKVFDALSANFSALEESTGVADDEDSVTKTLTKKQRANAKRKARRKREALAKKKAQEESEENTIDTIEEEKESIDIENMLSKLSFESDEEDDEEDQDDTETKS